MSQVISIKFEGRQEETDHDILQNPELALLSQVSNPKLVKMLTDAWVYGGQNLDTLKSKAVDEAYQRDGYDALTKNYENIIHGEVERRQNLLLESFLKERDLNPQTITNYIHLLVSSGYHEFCSDGLGYYNFNPDLNPNFLTEIQERNSDLNTHDWWSEKSQELTNKTPELSNNPDKLNQILHHLALILKLNDFNGAANWYQISLSESGEKLLKLIFEKYSGKIQAALQQYLVWTNSKIIANYPDLANKMLSPQKKFEYCSLLTNICVLLFSSKNQNLFPIADYINTTTANWVPDNNKEMFGGEGSLTTVIKKFNLLPEDKILTGQNEILAHQDNLTNSEASKLIARIQTASQKYVRPDYKSLSIDEQKRLLEQAVQEIQTILDNPEIYTHLESKKTEYIDALTVLQQKLLAIAEYKKQNPDNDNILPLLSEQNANSLAVINHSGTLTSEQNLQLPKDILTEVLNLASDRAEAIQKELNTEPENKTPRKEVKKPSKIDQLKNKISEVGKKYIPLAVAVGLSIGGSWVGVNLLSKTGRSNVLSPGSNLTTITEIDNTKPPESVGTYQGIKAFVPKKDTFGRVVIEPRNISNEEFGRKVHFPNSTQQQLEEIRKRYPEARVDTYNLRYSDGYQIVPGYKPIAFHSTSGSLVSFDAIVGENGELININSSFNLPIQVLSIPIANTKDSLDSNIALPFSQNKLQQKTDDLKIRQESEKLMKNYDYRGFLAQIKDPKVRNYIDNLGKNQKGEISQKKLLEDLKQMYHKINWGNNFVLSDDQNPKNTALNIIETFRIDENGKLVSTSPIICNQFADLGSFLWQIKTRNLAFVVTGGSIGKEDEYKLKPLNTHASSILELKTLDGKSQFAQIDFTAESGGTQDDSTFDSAIKQLYSLGVSYRNLAINLLLGAGVIGLSLSVAKNGKTILKFLPKVPLEKLQQIISKFPQKKIPDSNSSESNPEIGGNPLTISTSVLSGEIAQELKYQIQTINRDVENPYITEQTPLAKVITYLASTSSIEDPSKSLKPSQNYLKPSDPALNPEK